MHIILGKFGKMGNVGNSVGDFLGAHETLIPSNISLLWIGTELLCAVLYAAAELRRAAQE